MHYKIHYSCLSHIGNVRNINQDNFICDRQYLNKSDTVIEFPLCGTKMSDDMSVFGIFDGMGGEECGEIASYIASKSASNIQIGKGTTADLVRFCHKANNDICDYAALHGVSAMGTTAAMLVFTDKEIILCNIGDSKIFRLCGSTLEQISKDHVSVSAFGVKPPLSQNLGIPTSEMIIDPYVAKGRYNDGDIFLICSDGLTDMVTSKHITRILMEAEFDKAAKKLLDTALENGGRDNITIILCKVEKEKRSLLSKIFRLRNERKEESSNGNWYSEWHLARMADC